MVSTYKVNIVERTLLALHHSFIFVLYAYRLFLIAGGLDICVASNTANYLKRLIHQLAAEYVTKRLEFEEPILEFEQFLHQLGLKFKRKFSTATSAEVPHH